jgi:hypothetical protein
MNNNDIQKMAKMLTEDPSIFNEAQVPNAQARSCSACGTTTPPNYKFCGACGAQVGGQSAQGKYTLERNGVLEAKYWPKDAKFKLGDVVWSKPAGLSPSTRGQSPLGINGKIERIRNSKSQGGYTYLVNADVAGQTPPPGSAPSSGRDWVHQSLLTQTRQVEG